MTWRIIFRPYQSGWPQKRTAHPKRAPFRSAWGQTRRLLCDEVAKLQLSTQPDEVVIQVDVDESDIRIDGGLRANSRVRSPGVIVTFESRHGPQRYCCDAFDRNEDNIRAVALGLEALRKVDRYGITQDGAQYTGFKALGSGIAMPAAKMTWEQAHAFLGEQSGTPLPAMVFPETIDAAYRRAAKRLHPDVGGDPVLFKKLVEARDLLVAS